MNKYRATFEIDSVERVQRLRQLAVSLGLYQARGTGAGVEGSVGKLLDVLALAAEIDPDQVASTLTQLIDTVLAGASTIHIYEGWREPTGCVVRVDDRPLPSHHWGSTAWEWGYRGAGPGSLAYDLLAYEFSVATARHYEPALLREMIATLPHAPNDSHSPPTRPDWHLTSVDLRQWLMRQPTPARFYVALPETAWVRPAAGPPEAQLLLQFLPQRRLAIHVLRDPQQAGLPTVTRAVEQVWRNQSAQSGAWETIRAISAADVILE